MLNSRLTPFTATYRSRHPFFRSYGARLPSSLTRFHSRAFSIFYSPTCVGLRYGRPRKHAALFLGAWLEQSGSARGLTVPLRDWHIQSPAAFAHTRPNDIILSRCRNIKPALSIAYALRPRLRTRLTLGGRTLPRKPWVYGGRGSHPSYRYSCLHSHLWQLHLGFPHGFDVATTLPYQSNRTNPAKLQSFGMTLIANHFRRGNTR